ALPVSRADAQGFGSALTYARRYGLSAAVGIAPEDDDGNLAAAAKPTDYSKHTARQTAVDAFESSSPEEQTWLREQAMEIIGLAEKNGDLHAHIEAQRYDVEQKLALWSLLPSNVRSAIKKQQNGARLGSQP